MPKRKEPDPVTLEVRCEECGALLEAKYRAVGSPGIALYVGTCPECEGRIVNEILDRRAELREAV